MISKFMDILIFILAKTPLQLLYFLSKTLTILNANTIKYRKKIIKRNIRLSFPKSSHKDKTNLINKFYMFLFDLIIEIIKAKNFKKKDILKRVQINNLSTITDSIKTKKSIILMSAHYNNWEWLLLRVSLINDVNLAAVYQPISNKYFDDLLLNIRNKFGATLVPLKKWKYFIIKNKKKPYVFMCVCDQVPEKKVNGKRIRFLNQTTLFDTGTEKIVKLLNADVVYSEVVKVKQGYYSVNFKKINAKNITKKYAELLEKNIQETPQNWLWSHNRWKR